MNINKDDLFYVCTMIEYVSRHTHNKCKDIVAKIPDDELEHQLKVAEINHCLPCLNRLAMSGLSNLV